MQHDKLACLADEIQAHINEATKVGMNYVTLKLPLGVWRGIMGALHASPSAASTPEEVPTKALLALEHQHLRACLTELLRLYDWRNELGRIERDFNHDKKQMTMWLNHYGREKKQAWFVARELLTGSRKTHDFSAPSSEVRRDWFDDIRPLSEIVKENTKASSSSAREPVCSLCNATAAQCKSLGCSDDKCPLNAANPPGPFCSLSFAHQPHDSCDGSVRAPVSHVSSSVDLLSGLRDWMKSLGEAIEHAQTLIGTEYQMREALKHCQHTYGKSLSALAGITAASATFAPNEGSRT